MSARVYCSPTLPASWPEHERHMAMAIRAEESMRVDEPPSAANPTPLASIALARVRIEQERFYAAYGRRHSHTTDNEPATAQGSL